MNTIPEITPEDEDLITMSPEEFELRFVGINTPQQPSEPEPAASRRTPVWAFSIDYSDRSGGYSRTQYGIVFADTEAAAIDRVWKLHGQSIYAYNLNVYAIDSDQDVIDIN